MPPRIHPDTPLSSPHAPELLFAVGWLKIATAAQAYAITSFGSRGQPTTSLDAMLSRLVKCGLMRSVRVPPGPFGRGRPLRAYLLTPAGLRAVGLDAAQASQLSADALNPVALVSRLERSETFLQMTEDGWNNIRTEKQFEVIRGWALGRAAGVTLDGTPQLLQNGLKKMPADTPLGTGFSVYRRGGRDLTSATECRIIAWALSAEQARLRVQGLEPMLGITVALPFSLVGSDAVRAQFARSLAKTLTRRNQKFEIVPLDLDFRHRSKALRSARTVEERQECSLPFGATFPWGRPWCLEALVAAGFRDLSLMTNPPERPRRAARLVDAPAPPSLDSMDQEPDDPWALPLFDGQVGRSIQTPVTTVAPVVAPPAPRVVDPRWALCPPRKKGHVIPDVDLSGRGM